MRELILSPDIQGKELQEYRSYLSYIQDPELLFNCLEIFFKYSEDEFIFKFIEVNFEKLLNLLSEDMILVLLKNLSEKINDHEMLFFESLLDFLVHYNPSKKKLESILPSGNIYDQIFSLSNSLRIDDHLPITLIYRYYTHFNSSDLLEEIDILILKENFDLNNLKGFSKLKKCTIRFLENSTIPLFYSFDFFPPSAKHVRIKNGILGEKELQNIQGYNLKILDFSRSTFLSYHSFSTWNFNNIKKLDISRTAIPSNVVVFLTFPGTSLEELNLSYCFKIENSAFSARYENMSIQYMKNFEKESNYENRSLTNLNISHTNLSTLGLCGIGKQFTYLRVLKVKNI